jgi:uncharacterized protein (DUF4415 family)
LAEGLLALVKQSSASMIDIKKKLIRPSAKKDAASTKAAKSDLNACPYSNKEWSKVKPNLIRGHGSLLGSGTKGQVTLRIDSDTLAFYKSKASGWQTLINQLLSEIKKESRATA